jgi:hypothetical protein
MVLCSEYRCIIDCVSGIGMYSAKNSANLESQPIQIAIPAVVLETAANHILIGAQAELWGMMKTQRDKTNNKTSYSNDSEYKRLGTMAGLARECRS